MTLGISRKQRLGVAIVISCMFFVAELLVSFETGSLALLADSFHYINDIVGFAIGLLAIYLSERTDAPRNLSFGWQRASLLGAFFNGVFLLALGISIFLQSIERFVSLQRMEKPLHVLIMGCVGLGLNLISVLVLHESHCHEPRGGDAHSRQCDKNSLDDSNTIGLAGDQTRDTEEGGSFAPLSIRTESEQHASHRHAAAKPQAIGRDLGMLGVMLHVAGDALNNLGVAIAAVIIWKTDNPARYYADPGVSLLIAVMIVVTAVPLVKRSGEILLQTVPVGVDPIDVRHDLEKIPGIQSVHELHIWRLDQRKSIASVHVVVEDEGVGKFMEKAKTVSQCLHAYGIHTSTIQPEVLPKFVPSALSEPLGAGISGSSSTLSASSDQPKSLSSTCQLPCRGQQLCENFSCCS